MIGNKQMYRVSISSKQPSERGVALLTVLALLTIFAVILAGFTYSLKMEEFSVRMYGESINSQDSADAAVSGVLGQVDNDLDPSKPHNVAGRMQPKYISQMDPWYVGYAGRVTGNLFYDARSRELDSRPVMQLQRQNLKLIPTPIPLGIDEDPKGDGTGLQKIGGLPGSGMGDSKPGLGGIDDNLDGIVDHDFNHNGKIAAGFSASDDDEDGLADEDPYDLRRADNRGSGFFAPGTGYDEDGDAVGVYDESAKININAAGNNAASGKFIYNTGLSPSELDLPVFLYNRLPNLRQADQVALRIVNYRNGSVTDGGSTTRKPGVDTTDDNNNNSPGIFKMDRYSVLFKTPQFDREPFAIVGNGKDDDGDGLVDEEDERYIGSLTYNQAGSAFNDPLKNDSTTQDFRPGDRLDNNGDGFIDENREGIDEPAEFSVTNPKGDDHPYSTVNDLMNITDIAEIQLDHLRNDITIYGQADQISGPLSGMNNEISKINPNTINNWRAVSNFDQSNPQAGKVDVQYNPPVRVDDLLALQVDNDGDWQLETEPDVKAGKPDGKDNDGDGLIDEPSDDWDGNFYPSGDFDGYMEPDVASPFYRNNGTDDDNDTQVRDEKPGTVDAKRQSRIFPRSEDAKESELLAGLTLEGNGQDDDGDGLVDDDGDFNGDGLLTYDPEWHVNEDAAGDASADGFPGLGAPLGTQDKADEFVLNDPQHRDDLLVTSFADDDWDGFADFYDPQVVTAMVAPEMDGVDNDNDGEVDEVGERYVAAYDDDEDGRMDEDPPEFQIALNLADYIDTWGPAAIANDPDIKKVLTSSNDTNPVLSDPVTIKKFKLSSTRQRAFRMFPRILAGINSSARERMLYTEYMRLMLPNPPQTGMEITYEGVESIRINEVMPKPVIRLFASECLDAVIGSSTDAKNVKTTIRYQTGSRFKLNSGGDDDGIRPSLTNVYDSNWGMEQNALSAGSLAVEPLNGFSYLPDGFTNTYNPYVPIANMDSLSPAFIFGVTNVAVNANDPGKVGKTPVEEAEWNFPNLPNGIYDVVIYLNPNHAYYPSVHYFFTTAKGENEIKFRSDFRYGNNVDDSAWAGAWGDPKIQTAFSTILGTGATQTGMVNWIQRDIARYNSFRYENVGEVPNLARIQTPSAKKLFPLPNRLSPFPPPDRSNFQSATQRVEITDGNLKLRIRAEAPVAGDTFYATSFNYLELIDLSAQYVELVNIGLDDVNLSGWTVNTPYGHYVIPEGTVIGRMKPLWKGDDAKVRTTGEGLKGNAVPFEPLLDKNKIGKSITQQDAEIENNKLLLAFDKVGLTKFIKDNYQSYSVMDKYIVEPVLADRELARMQDAKDGAAMNSQPAWDKRFRLVDLQDDILTDNPEEKWVTLYDPAGGYMDRFKYRTTFNNVIADIPSNNKGNAQSLDLIALPGYKGFESFERTDPTYFESETVVDQTKYKGVATPNSDLVHMERSVPSSIKLDVQNAVVSKLTIDKGSLKDLLIGGYSEKDLNRPSLKRFVDVRVPSVDLFAGFADPSWNGWDFIGDRYIYPKDISDTNLKNRIAEFDNALAMAREGNAPRKDFANQLTRFYQLLGGFENFKHIDNSDPNAQAFKNAKNTVTVFTWRMGLRELIRAGYDPNIDDQLTARVVGRKYADPQGFVLDIDMPVGEVMVQPAYRFLNPGDTENKPSGLDVPLILSKADTKASSIYLNGTEVLPVFSKLRNGDTAFTIDLREDTSNLWKDLNDESSDEPKIEISVVMRKTTPDYSPAFKSKLQTNSQEGVLYPKDRPDFEAHGFVASGTQTITKLEYEKNNNFGAYGFIKNPEFKATGDPMQNEFLGSTGDDNYYFKGIELFGRSSKSGLASTKDDAAKMAYLGGTPGWDNTGYVPAYPRRRQKLDGRSRDKDDVIDNTAYVKNGPLATVGELSRLFTGNKFETVNTPLIPQRLEDMMVINNRVMSTPDIGMKAISSHEAKVQLAERERLDQWENQYASFYDMLTTYSVGKVPGLININTAPREVLMALPSTPPSEPGKLEILELRHNFNSIVADFILEGREPGGHDLAFGIEGLDDDQYLSDFYKSQRTTDNLPEFKLYGSGREKRFFNNYDDLKPFMNNAIIQNVRDQQLTNFTDMYTSVIQSNPDDGPYPDIGALLTQISHLKRRERFSNSLSKNNDRTWDGVRDGAGDLRDRLNDFSILSRQLTPEDMEEMMNRISNLITVRSDTFSITARGRVLDGKGNILSQRKLETVYRRH